MAGIFQNIPSVRTLMRCFMVVLAVLFATPGIFAAETGKTTEWWLENYGDYTKTVKANSTPRVKWAFRTFEDVNNVVHEIEGRFPRLHIIDDTDNHPYATALADGGIIITPATISVCCEGVSPSEAKLRFAFVFAHELAHLAHNDYLYLETIAFLRRSKDRKISSVIARTFKPHGIANGESNKMKEIQADKKAIHYAAMAGYDIASLFHDNDFLEKWVKQSDANYFVDSRDHPSMADRVRIIRSTISNAVKEIDRFNAGVLLFQAGNHGEARKAFEEFLQFHPGRKVLNNIGACSLHCALNIIHCKYNRAYYRHRLSTGISYSTTASKMTPRNADRYLADKRVAELLEKAEDCFIRAAKNDSRYPAAQYNLAAVKILKKDYAGAQSECKTLLQKYPSDVRLLNNRAVALYYFGETEGFDTAQKAIHLLEKAHRLDHSNVEVLYNLALFKELCKQEFEAKCLRQRYLQRSDVPRDNFYNYLYEKTYDKAPAPHRKADRIPNIPERDFIDMDFAVAADKWGKNDTESPADQNIALMPNETTRVLALGGTIEIVEKNLKHPKPIDRLLKTYGPPEQVLDFNCGKFLIYKSRGFSIKEIDGKACAYIFY